LLLIYSFVVAVAPHSTVSARNTDPQPQIQDDGGLRFRLSEGTEQPEARPATTPVSTTALSDAETEAVLKRLPPIKSETSDETDFATRSQSLPPPRTGLTIAQPFPAANEMAPPDSTTAGTLEVIRYSPQGDVPITPNLSVTFSQPMVAISSQEEAAKYVPVKLTPEPHGKWRWIGTKTLLFEPDVRFAMATQYSVSVPAGTKSAIGGTLSSEKSWTFTTPAPKVKTTYPYANDPRPLDSLMFVEFDQRIDPAAVLKTITLSTTGNTQLPLRLATKEEIEADWYVKDLVKAAQKDRWLAFRAIDSNGDTKNALPINTYMTVRIGPGTPSIEGPRTTSTKQEFYFYTYGPFHITQSLCGYLGRCKPNDPWRIEFNNPIALPGFEESQVRIEPAMDGLRRTVSGNTLVIDGLKKPETTFRVTLDKSLADSFGQKLGKDETLEFKVGPADPFIWLSGNGFVVLDPDGPRQLSLYTTN